MPPKQLRNLSYQAPETPSFLRALKAQVASPHSHRLAAPHAKPSDSRSGADGTLDGLLSTRTSTGHAAQQTLPDADSEDDDLSFAQVVVLKQGKHLSKEEAQQARQHQLLQRSDADAPTDHNIAQAGSSVPKRKRTLPSLSSTSDEQHRETAQESLQRALAVPGPASGSAQKRKRLAATGAGDGGNLEEVKQLLRQQRQQRQDKERRTDAGADDKGPSQIDEKQRRRQLKNQAAREAKKKSGKGLSFSMDD
ncbi:hypothetical protein ACQY0O_006033 [Thecaphora frezii]